MPLSALAQDYQAQLKSLTSPDKVTITGLSMVAETHKEEAKNIVEAIAEHVLNCPVKSKVPGLYLMDSIVKNVGGSYRDHFTAHLLKVFAHVWAYGSQDSSIRKSLTKLHATWKGYFPAGVLEQLAQVMAPSVPTGGMAATSGSFTSVSGAYAPVSVTIPTHVPAIVPRPVVASCSLQAQQPQPITVKLQTTVHADPRMASLTGPFQPAASPAPSAVLASSAQSQLLQAVLLAASQRASSNIWDARPAAHHVGLPQQPNFPMGQQAYQNGYLRNTIVAPQQIAPQVEQVAPHLAPLPPQPAPQVVPQIIMPPVTPQLAPQVLQQQAVPQLAPQPAHQLPGGQPAYLQVTSVGMPMTQVPVVPSMVNVLPVRPMDLLPMSQPPPAMVPPAVMPPPPPPPPRARRGSTPPAGPSPPVRTSEILKNLEALGMFMNSTAAEAKSTAEDEGMDKTDFDIPWIKELHGGVVKRLLKASDDHRGRLLDSAFHRRRRQRTGAVQARRWYVDVESWVTGTIVLPEESNPFLGLEERSPSPKPEPIICCPVDDNQLTCAISGERFEEFYNDEEGKWYNKDARRVTAEEAANLGLQEGVIVKVKCLPASGARSPLVHEPEVGAVVSADDDNHAHVAAEAAAMPGALSDISGTSVEADPGKMKVDEKVVVKEEGHTSSPGPLKRAREEEASPGVRSASPDVSSSEIHVAAGLVKEEQTDSINLERNGKKSRLA